MRSEGRIKKEIERIKVLKKNNYYFKSIRDAEIETLEWVLGKDVELF